MGMSALAKLLQDAGWRVSGSDDAFYPPVSDYLAENKIAFTKGHKKENIPAGANLIVIGKHAGLTPQENQEVKAAFETGVPVKSFAEVLGELTKDKENIVVAGSYGKSTCAALLAWCLQRSGFESGWFVGAVGKTPPQSSFLGRGKMFVLEGDEYPSSNWDNNSKFLHYHPNHLLLTSLAHDHLNIFKTEESYRESFKKLIDMVPSDGLIIACTDGYGIKETLNELSKRAVFYGLSNNSDWHIENPEHDEISSFDIFRDNKKIVRITTKLLGRHNMENILGVGALLLSLKLVTPEKFVKAVSEFEPLQRRLDKKSEKTRVPVYEGFGSSRDKAKSVINAIKTRYPKRKLIVLFEPHAFSWRSPQALSWYNDAFSGADKVLIYKPAADGAQLDQLSLSEIIERVAKSGADVAGFESIANGLEIFEKIIDENSAVLVLSSGAFDGMIEKAVGFLEQKFPKR